jgi:hypothetical protein
MPQLVRMRTRAVQLSLPPLFLALTTIVSCNANNPTSPPGPEIAGDWLSGASVYRITTKGTQVKAVFEEVSQEAEVLGFKKGDESFEGVRKGNFLQGEHLIRYSGNNPCYKTGRRVPFMGLIWADGQQIILDWYNPAVSSETCQDVSRTLGMTQLVRRK